MFYCRCSIIPIIPIEILTGSDLDEYALKLTIRNLGETDVEFRSRLKQLTKKETMKECTLEEAVRLCKKNGGVFWPNIINPCKYSYDQKTNRFINEKEECLGLMSEAFEISWIYEPPEQSVFQKWENEQPSYFRDENPGIIKGARKEGYNFAIDEAMRMTDVYDGSLKESLRELKEK